MRLPPDEAHVWRVNLELPEHTLNRLFRLLSAEELERLAKFRFPHLQRRFVASHGALRTILSAYLHTPPDRLEYAYEPHGKPKLKDESLAKSLSFNLAHSHELALIAVARNPWIGVDVEYRRGVAYLDQIARRFFSPEEYRSLCQLPPQEKHAAFFACWTCKEAFIKAIGAGLSYPLAHFAVSFTPGQPVRLLEIADTRESCSAWSLFGFEPWASYTAALAVRAAGVHLSFWQWSPRLLAFEPEG